MRRKTHLKEEFLKELSWFYDELNIIFREKYNNYNKKDIEIANKILDIMSETINKYGLEDFIYILTNTLVKIENEYSRLLK